MRNAARADDCQPEIVKALRSAGVQVYVLKLPLDLLVSYRKPGEAHTRTLMLECKDDDGRITKTQAEFMATWPGEFHIVRSPRDALLAVLGKDALA